MTSFRVVAIDTAIAESVRSTLRSPGYGHPAHTEIATGYGPCRHCLRTFRVGAEARILFTYDPFEGVEELPLPGPVFVHAEACERYPEDGGFPGDLRPHALTLNAYAHGCRLRAQEYVVDGAVDAALERLLARPEIDYVHVRDTAAGCYDLRVERASANGPVQ
ncbi:MAG TPA: DUF1203 domain-containing protein [Thermoanaerobaculia bacterium]|nr:DUF1203 domain-containing protein [Thermoanaerobaculia bacterium]